MTARNDFTPKLSLGSSLYPSISNVSIHKCSFRLCPSLRNVFTPKRSFRPPVCLSETFLTPCIHTDPHSARLSERFHSVYLSETFPYTNVHSGPYLYHLSETFFNPNRSPRPPPRPSLRNVFTLKRSLWPSCCQSLETYPYAYACRSPSNVSIPSLTKVFYTYSAHLSQTFFTPIQAISHKSLLHILSPSLTNVGVHSDVHSAYLSKPFFFFTQMLNPTPTLPVSHIKGFSFAPSLIPISQKMTFLLFFCTQTFTPTFHVAASAGRTWLEARAGSPQATP